MIAGILERLLCRFLDHDAMGPVTGAKQAPFYYRCRRCKRLIVFDRERGWLLAKEDRPPVGGLRPHPRPRRDGQAGEPFMTIEQRVRIAVPIVMFFGAFAGFALGRLSLQETLGEQRGAGFDVGYRVGLHDAVAGLEAAARNHPTVTHHTAEGVWTMWQMSPDLVCSVLVPEEYPPAGGPR